MSIKPSCRFCGKKFHNKGIKAHESYCERKNWGNKTNVASPIPAMRTYTPEEYREGAHKAKLYGRLAGIGDAIVAIGYMLKDVKNEY